jgi:ribose transport system substrate-binding protein
MIRKLLLTALLLLTLINAGCARTSEDTSLLAQPSTTLTSQSTEATPQAPKYNIALVMKTLTNPFFVEMEKGARKAEKEMGINLIVKTGAQETSVDQQITIIEELIKEKVDAILIAPADSVQLIPVLKKAQDSGIVIINLDNQLDAQSMEKVGLKDVPYISVDNVNGAYLSAKYITDKVSTPTQAIILEGIPTAKNAQDRKNGAIKAFDENSNIKVVASETAHWKVDEAYQVTSQIFQQYPHAKLIFCANDMMALGALQYLKENNITVVQVAAYDALDEVMPMLHDGSMQATIDQQAANQAYTGVQFAIRALQGEKLPALTLLDVLLVTSENAR